MREKMNMKTIFKVLGWITGGILFLFVTLFIIGITISYYQYQKNEDIKKPILWENITIPNNINAKVITKFDECLWYRIQIENMAPELWQTMKPNDGFELLLYDSDGFLLFKHFMPKKTFIEMKSGDKTIAYETNYRANLYSPETYKNVEAVGISIVSDTKENK